MDTYDNAYSRLVAWAKVILPLVALAILSTLFLLARAEGPAQKIPYSDIDPAAVAREQRVSGPTYAGMTTDGAAVAVSAETVQPGPEGAFKAHDLHARIDLPEGGHATLDAAGGAFDPAAAHASLAGGVTMESSTGWTVRGEAFDVELDSATVSSAAPVTAEGPAGQLEAGSMTLSSEPKGYVLLFDGGVRVLYEPADRR